MIEQLLALLRLGLGNSNPEKESLSDFIMLPANKWAMIGEIAMKQGVLGIVLDGLDVLGATPYGTTRELSAQQKLEWIGQVMMIEQENHRQCEIMNNLSQKWTEAGCKVMVMKGQANALMYPNPAHRSPGDIDCYLFGNYQLGNDIAREAGAKVDKSWYKHSEIHYKNVLFENHQYFVHTREGKRSKRLDEELKNTLNVDESFFRELTSYTIMPPVQWTAMFLTYHACGHFLSEGLRLKQLLDWAMFLKCHQDEVDWEAFYEYCDRYHLKRFAVAVTAISRDKLGVDLSNPVIEYKSPYAEKVLNCILYDDDYVYSEDGGGWKEKIHIVKNLFKYRWKYEDIYQESIFKQLWWYISGYLFHTE